MVYRTVLTCLLLVATSNALAGDLFVSHAGNDSNPGTKQQPLSSLESALARMNTHDGGTIWLEEGSYWVGKGIVLGQRSSGTAKSPTVIRSVVPHAARITGARQVTGFRPISPEEAASLISKEARQRVVVADLKSQGFPPLSEMPDRYRAAGREEVVFGDVPMQSARWPNDGFTAFTEVIDAGASAPVHWVRRDVYRPGSFRFPSDRAKHWDFSRGVYLHGFWCYEWADEVLRAASYNRKTGELRFAAKHTYGIGNPHKKNSKREFYALHVFEELDQPGEYYLDRQSQKLFFWPPGDVEKTSVWLTLCRNPLLKAANVSHLVLQDLVFENGCAAAIQFDACNNTRIEHCLVRNMGLGGVNVTDGANHCVIRCEVTQTGSRAISMHAGDRKSLSPGNGSVVGNHLHHLGRFDWGGGRGVVLGGCGNRVANNLIHHCPTGAVAYGGNEHTLELNEIHDVCLLYSDVGVFYTGRDWASRGNIVRWNYIHGAMDNVAQHGFGSQAFYLDDCDSGDQIVGNIVCGGVGKGVVIGGGRDNVIRGNIFMYLDKGIHVDARGPRGITFDEPGSWNLKAKCEQMDYLSPLWKRRYPKLARVLDEQPLMPLGNVMRDNIFIDCKEPWALRKDVKPEWLTRANNSILKASDFAFLNASSRTGALDLSMLSKLWKDVAHFTPIPVEKIGLRGVNGLKDRR